MNRSTPGLPVHHQLPAFTQTQSIESVMPSSHLILCCPLLLLPPIPPSIRVFSNESTLRMRCPKYWSFSFSIIPSKEIPGLISFRIAELNKQRDAGSSSFSSVQFSSVTQSCPTLCDPMNCSTPRLPVHHQLPEFTQIRVHESVMPSSHLILCRPLLLLPPVPPSITVFSNESTLRMRWAKYWSFSFSIIPSKEIPGLISFRMDWLDLLAVQGTLKSLLQHHSSKAPIIWCSAFFIVQFSHSYMTTGKTIALTRWTFVDIEKQL